MTKRELLAMALKFVGIVYGLHAISSFLIELRTWSQFIAHGITNFTNLDVNGFWAIGIGLAPAKLDQKGVVEVEDWYLTRV